MSDVTFNMSDNSVEVHNKTVEPWKITLIDTGEKTMTGGRLKRIRHFLDESTFCMTYGDGVADVHIEKLISSHFSSKKKATLTAIQQPGRYGSLNINSSNQVVGFTEKPFGDGGWINGGFFVLEPSALDDIDGDDVIWEQAPMTSLAKNRELNAYYHRGFWKAMDTLRDKISLEQLWDSNNPPWKIW